MAAGNATVTVEITAGGSRGTVPAMAADSVALTPRKLAVDRPCNADEVGVGGKAGGGRGSERVKLFESVFVPDDA
jgi:hypothetical protein